MVKYAQLYNVNIKHKASDIDDINIDGQDLITNHQYEHIMVLVNFQDWLVFTMKHCFAVYRIQNTINLDPMSFRSYYSIYKVPNLDQF